MNANNNNANSANDTTTTTTTMNDKAATPNYNNVKSEQYHRKRTLSGNDFGVGDPIPFDYSNNEYHQSGNNEPSGSSNPAEMNGRDMLQMAQNVMTSDDPTRFSRRLVEPKNFREQQYSLPMPYTMQYNAMPPQYPGGNAMMYNHSAMPPTNGSFQAMLEQHAERQARATPAYTAPSANYNAPSGNTSYAAPSSGNGNYAAPPSGNGNYAPPSGNGSYAPPSGNGNYAQPSGNGFNPNFQMPYINTAQTVQVPGNGSVSIKLRTPLKGKYWRNGRRNLQCFPNCKVYGDYSYIKIDELKQHDFMWGKCRGALVADVSVSPTMQNVELIVLARIHSIEGVSVPFEELVANECMVNKVFTSEMMENLRSTWIIGDQLSTSVSSQVYEFKPKIWKYSEDMKGSKCKRRNVRYYCQLEVFVPYHNEAGGVNSFLCVGSGMSSSFEVGSSRVLARQKRKAASIAAGDNPPTAKVQKPVMNMDHLPQSLYPVV